MKAIYKTTDTDFHKGFAIETRQCFFKGKVSYDYLVDLGNKIMDSFDTLEEAYESVDQAYESIEFCGELAA